METAGPGRPRAIGIVGWLSVFLGVYFIVLGASAVWLAMHPQPPPGLSSRAMQEWARSMRFNGPVAGLQLAIGFVMLLASSWFLGLREVGRKTLEWLNWLGIAYTIVFTVRAVMFYQQTLGNQPGALLVPMEAGTIVWAAVRLAIIGLILAALRSREVRSAMHA